MNLLLFSVVIGATFYFAPIQGLISRQESPIVRITEGTLRGNILQSRDKRDYYAFQGIKYAKINKRFEPGVAPENWNGTRDAIRFGSECPSIDFVTKELHPYDEDCLYLNVYVPDLEKQDQRKLPVMAWIHGGGLMDGAGSQFGAKYFMDEDVILVTLNYRLGALGFLNTGDGVVSGNNGLRDMIMGLQWIQRNILEFGGDPNQVTIFGESGGAWAVHFLMLSPAAKGLFHGVIVQSGAALTNMGFTRDPVASNEALAAKLTCPTVPTLKMVECFRNKTVQQILEAQRDITFFGPSMDQFKLPFVPSVDSGENTNPEEKIVPAIPYEMIQGFKSDIPVILGLTENEGLFNGAMLLLNATFVKEFNDNWLNRISQLLYLRDFVPEDKLEEFVRELRRIYFEDEPLTIETADRLIEMSSQYGMYRFTRLSAELHSQTNPNVYPFMFTHRGGMSIVNLFGLNDRAPTHTDELQYLFNSMRTLIEWPDLTLESDIEFSKKFVKLWVSFATNGTPNATWGVNWEPAKNVGGPLDSEMRWYSINEKPGYFKLSPQLEEKYLRLDCLFARYENPQYSWRTPKLRSITDEL